MKARNHYESMFYEFHAESVQSVTRLGGLDEEIMSIVQLVLRTGELFASEVRDVES